MNELIVTDSLSKTYSVSKRGSVEVQAVKNATLTFQAGRSYAITGPSGCGKTTLLHMIGLLLTPTDGKIMIRSENVSSLSVKERSRIRNSFFGYIAQNFLLVDGYSVSENIEIPLLYSTPKISKRGRAEKIKKVLSEVGLSSKAASDVRDLSGGQRQRIAIARSMVNDPKVILADEPTGSLDAETGQRVFDLLSAFVRQGKTLLLVTHNNSIAQQCDDQIHMLDGKILRRPA